MLFSGIRCAISPTLPSQLQHDLTRLLEANGATMADFPHATHVVSNTLQFEGRESIPNGCHIVTDEWINRSIVQGKLQETKYFSADPIMIFSGVVACVADLEPCDTEVIAAGINALGGLFREGYTRDCTHVLAARPDSDKYLTAMHFASATHVKVVLPHWFDDCFKLLVRLPEDTYAWPDPPLLRTNYALRKARLSPPTKAIVKAAVLEEEPAEKIATQGRPESNIWHGRRVLLGSSLNLANGRREAVEASVQRAGGVIIQSSGDEDADVEDADVYITLYRIGRAFVKAMHARKLVGTLSWLFSVHKSGIITLPLDQILHFPSPRPPLPGFEKQKITATNYEGDARRYLKKLIELMGGSFTPQMTAQNTVVVAAYIEGAKSEKAREWNIPIVNHTWLEDCFATWTLVTPAQEKYVIFPPGVNFGDLVCKRHVPPMSEEDLKEIEHTSLEAEERERTEMEKAQGGQVKSPIRPSGMQDGKSQESDKPSPLKPAASRLNSQHSQHRHEEEEEVDENEKEESQPRKGEKRAVKRGREGNEEETFEIEKRQIRERARGHVDAQSSPIKRTGRPRVRSDDESEDDEEDYLPRKLGKASRTRTSGKSSPTKEGTKARVIRVEDDSDDDEPSTRRLDKTGKSASSRNKEQARAAVVNVRSPSKMAKGKSKSVLELLNDDEFTSSSDEPLSPIKTSKTEIGHQADVKAGRSKASKARRVIQFEDDEDEEEEKEKEPKSKKPHKIAVTEPKTPLRKQGPVGGPTPGKAVFVEISTPQKSSSPLSRTSSTIAAAVDGAGSRIYAKNGRIASNARHKNGDDDDRENESPTETPSRSNRPSDAAATAARRSSESTPIISSTGFQLLRTPSKRQAATKASAKLHENALDIIKFEKEKKSGRFRGAWEDAAEKAKVGSAKKDEEGKKRRASIVALDDESKVEESNARSKKKRKSDDAENESRKAGESGKKSKKPRISSVLSADEAEESQKEAEEEWYEADVHLMTTQVSLSDQTLKGLQKLGVKMASKPTECNLLLANNIGRTEKFLCAMATARSIVTEAWAVDSVKAKRILPPDDYFLKDSEGEKKHKFKLADALRRAQSSDTKLLEGHTFYFTKGLQRSEKVTTYRNVIQSAGGKVALTNPTVRILKDHDDRHVLSVEGDKAITDPLVEEGFHIYIPEFILVGILTQRMDWNNTPHRLDRN